LLSSNTEIVSLAETFWLLVTLIAKVPPEKFPEVHHQSEVGYQLSGSEMLLIAKSKWKARMKKWMAVFLRCCQSRFLSLLGCWHKVLEPKVLLRTLSQNAVQLVAVEIGLPALPEKVGQETNGYS
jgi:hypothetical protein